MKARQVYTVMFYGAYPTTAMAVIASNKKEAYFEAIKRITEQEGEEPYAAWVVSVTFQNGNWKRFDTDPKHPY